MGFVPAGRHCFLLGAYYLKDLFCSYYERAEYALSNRVKPHQTAYLEISGRTANDKQ